MNPSPIRKFDVVAFGETMVRFTPPGYQRFEQSVAVEMHVGGSESNTLVGLARLGHTVSWISSLTDGFLGSTIASQLAAQQVDLSHVLWTDSDRVGTFFMERGIGPRSTQIEYDRAATAVSRMAPSDITDSYLQGVRCRYFHTTGITLGLSESAAETGFALAHSAKRQGSAISFDFNYRSRLWDVPIAIDRCEEFVALADLVFIPRKDARRLFQLDESPPDTAKALSARWPGKTVVITLGHQGAVAVDAQGNLHRQAAFATHEVERLGGGDAFSAGFLSAILRSMPIAQALRWGNAMASLKYTIPGDMPLVDRDLVHQLVATPETDTSETTRESSSPLPEVGHGPGHAGADIER